MKGTSRDFVDERCWKTGSAACRSFRQPFAEIAHKALGIERSRTCLTRLERLQALGVVARVGGVVRPNTLGASTLAAVAAPDLEVDDRCRHPCCRAGHQPRLSARKRLEPLVRRDRSRSRICRSQLCSRIAVEDGSPRARSAAGAPLPHRSRFRPAGAESRQHELRSISAAYSKPSPIPGDRERWSQCLTTDCRWFPEPFQAIAAQLDRTRGDVIARITSSADAGVVPRIGVIVRHRALGWRSNAMVVWDIPADDIDRAGAASSRRPRHQSVLRRTRHRTRMALSISTV